MIQWHPEADKKSCNVEDIIKPMMMQEMMEATMTQASDGSSH
ncbi:hypothetical protein Gotur_032942 [Gossypium turneri]